VHAEPLKCAMEEETRLLSDYAARLGSLQQIVGNRDWDAVEKSIAALRHLASEIEGAEAARAHAYRSLKTALLLSGEEPFDLVASRLGSPAREELRDRHRRLKIAIIRVTGASGLLGYYVRSIADARRQALEELFPHRKGRLYSRSGRAKATADESMVLDRKY